MISVRSAIEVFAWLGIGAGSLSIWFACDPSAFARHSIPITIARPEAVVAMMTPDQFTAWVLAICGAATAVVNTAYVVGHRVAAWREGRAARDRRKPRWPRGGPAGHKKES